MSDNAALTRATTEVSRLIVEVSILQSVRDDLRQRIKAALEYQADLRELIEQAKPTNEALLARVSATERTLRGEERGDE